MKLIIAEKDEVAKAISEALGGGQKQSGYYKAGEYIISSCSGHLLRLLEPEEYNPEYKKWSFDTLPMSFIPWHREVSDRGRRQYELLAPLVREASEIIHAGDPDEEGQFIVDSVLAREEVTVPVKRAMINDNSKAAILRELAEAEDNTKFLGLGQAADGRAIADQLYGYNMTRAYTLAAQARGYTETLNVGRVKTPILGLVVRRDAEFENHTAACFYIVDGDFEINGVTVSAVYKTHSEDPLDEKKRLSEEGTAKTITELIQGKSGKVISVETKHCVESPPLPYNLLKLQADAARLYKYKPVDVKDITQRLRGRKLITYNRSDCQYLKEERHGDAPNVLAAIETNTKELNALLEQTDPNIKSRAFDSSKITAHHAIIPTETTADFSTLKEDERRIYMLIAKAYCLQFLSNYEYDRTDLLLEVEGRQFACWSKTVTVPGWKQISGDIHEEETEDTGLNIDFNNFTRDMPIQCKKAKYSKKTTKPKPRYTIGTLLSDLPSVAKYMKDERLRAIMIEKDQGKEGEHGGIGTPATRDDIIQSLFDDGFIEPEKPGSDRIKSTRKGREFYTLLPEQAKYPDMTAVWHEMQRQVAKGEMSVFHFVESVMETISTEVSRVKEEDIKLSGMFECPECGAAIKRRKRRDGSGFFWGCTAYPECKKTVPDKNGKPDYQVKTTSQASNHKCTKCGKPLRFISAKNDKHGFWGCTGYKKEGDGCKQTYQDINGQPDLTPKSQASSLYNCMKCGKPLRFISGKNGKPDFWGCTGYQKEGGCTQIYQDLKGKPDYSDPKEK